jgi:hypothetical protein
VDRRDAALTAVLCGIPSFSEIVAQAVLIDLLFGLMPEWGLSAGFKKAFNQNAWEASSDDANPVTH